MAFTYKHYMRDHDQDKYTAIEKLQNVTTYFISAAKTHLISSVLG